MLPSAGLLWESKTTVASQLDLRPLTIAALIRKYGYRWNSRNDRTVSANADLAGDLSAAAHLVHRSSEQGFAIRWCPGQPSKEEVEGVRFGDGDLKTMLVCYDLRKLRHGHNPIDGEEIFLIANPGWGLWVCRDKSCAEGERGK